jgi:AcrR family transcriptional regulator
MKAKNEENQTSVRRRPRQARSQQKIELMFEAAVLLLNEGNLQALTTNAVAARAGVSIGTLYQYFGDKDALLDALVTRELGEMSEKVLASLVSQETVPGGDRIRRIVRAALGVCGGRGRVHRMLIEHAMNRATGNRLSPFYTRLIEAFTSGEVRGPGAKPLTMPAGKAFVLTHAVAGVLRSYALSHDPPPQGEIEDALVELIVGFAGAPTKGRV